ncbi:MADS-box transcription factor [Parasponia andersonii]|uniref:MADS-box transcription factor n=1 Tax=Parasponia andersonii TaxID=3476 RepID=A0A2P5CWA2_PARAD|nr:MADS-box transcription factor [Parasponia andersonii]
MARKKLNLAYIYNPSARKGTFKKRRKGLLKKLSNLTTFCCIDTCAIIYSPYEAQPKLFPSAAGVHHVLVRFRKTPEMEQRKKMLNQEGLLSQRIAKSIEQLKRQRNDNREWELRQVIFQSLAGNTCLQGFSVKDFNDLRWLIDRNLYDIHKCKDRIIHNKMLVPLAAAAAPGAVADGKQTRGGESTIC